MISMYFEVKNNEKVPVNPLELAIKKGLKDVIKIIISEFSVTPSMISSNFNETLFEIAAVKGVKVFQMVMESISAATQIYIQRPIQIMLKLYNDLINPLVPNNN